MLVKVTGYNPTTGVTRSAVLGTDKWVDIFTNKLAGLGFDVRVERVR